MNKLFVFVLTMAIFSENSFALGVANFPIMTNVSAVGSTVSTIIPLSQDLGYAIQAVWTGNPIGTLTVKASNDHQNPTNWDVLSGSSQTITGGAGSQLYNISQPFYMFAQLVFTSGSTVGSTVAGTISATATVKMP